MIVQCVCVSLSLCRYLSDVSSSLFLAIPYSPCKCVSLHYLYLYFVITRTLLANSLARSFSLPLSLSHSLTHSRTHSLSLTQLTLTRARPVADSRRAFAAPRRSDALHRGRRRSEHARPKAGADHGAARGLQVCVRLSGCACLSVVWWGDGGLRVRGRCCVTCSVARNAV